MSLKHPPLGTSSQISTMKFVKKFLEENVKLHRVGFENIVLERVGFCRLLLGLLCRKEDGTVVQLGSPP